MDAYLEYLPTYRVVVCRRCSVAVGPDALTTHLRGKAHESTLSQARSVVEDIANRQLDLCQPEDLETPTQPVLALPGIPVFRDGQRCILAPERCAYICRSEQVLREHWRKQHSWRLCLGRGGSGAAKREMTAERLQLAVRRPVLCQRLFTSRAGSHFFEVFVQGESVRPAVQQEQSAKDAILSKLAGLEKAQQQAGKILATTASAKEISPWLQLTRWLGYLDGHCLHDVSKLARPPAAGSEGRLVEVCASIDRLVDKAFTAVREEQINPFDHVRINSFLQRPRVSDRPLAFKLQPSTVRRYKDVWKRLLCFVYRTMEYEHVPRLRHRLSNTQVVRYAQLLQSIRSLEDIDTHATVQECATHTAQAEVDESCLELCISLLDHTLYGDIYESAIVGFLAVAAVDDENNILREAHLCSSFLSGFVKIAQMLVIQRALVGVEREEATSPAALLDEMRERFLVYGTRSPFSWACRLRAYAKKVRDTTTSLGYISWSEDGTAVSYKDVSCLTMSRLREFVRVQVDHAQGLLEELLFVGRDDSRKDLGIGFWMHRVADNACENRRGWNFLKLDRNLAGPLPPRDTWLLERILDHEWLMDDFLEYSQTGSPAWRPRAAEQYKTRVDKFLEILLLLIHITSGQPARGTEILSLRHMNTICGYHRNIFADHGVVNTVTMYHKGYNVTGSVKIIHRFLPKEVGELLVYYLWLVLPFCQKLDLLVFQRQEQPSAFLWSKPGGRDCWSSERLSQVLRREFMAKIGVPMSTSVWRHLAIAISRKHLTCGGFKRDYDADDTSFDKQSTHSTRTAGSVYARGLEEAAGHVEQRRAGYRKVSQEWHILLGFLPQRQPFVDLPVQSTGQSGRHAIHEGYASSSKRRLEIGRSERDGLAKRPRMFKDDREASFFISATSDDQENRECERNLEFDF